MSNLQKLIENGGRSYPNQKTTGGIRLYYIDAEKEKLAKIVEVLLALIDSIKTTATWDVSADIDNVLQQVGQIAKGGSK